MSTPPTPLRRKTRPLPPEATLDINPTLSGRQKMHYLGRWLIVATVIVTLIILFRTYHLAYYLQQDVLQAWLASMGPWAPVAFIGTVIGVMLIYVVPFAAMCALGGILFGTVWGTFWSLVGGTCAAIVVLLVTRYLGTRVLNLSIDSNPRWKFLSQRLEEDGFFYLLLIRATSVVPFNVVNVVSAIAMIKMRHFIPATIIGLLPSAFVYAYTAKTLVSLKISNTQLGLVVSAVLLLVLTPIIYRQYRQHRLRLKQRLSIQQAFANPVPEEPAHGR